MLPPTFTRSPIIPRTEAPDLTKFVCAAVKLEGTPSLLADPPISRTRVRRLNGEQSPGDPRSDVGTTVFAIERCAWSITSTLWTHFQNQIAWTGKARADGSAGSLKDADDLAHWFCLDHGWLDDSLYGRK